MHCEWRGFRAAGGARQRRAAGGGHSHPIGSWMPDACVFFLLATTTLRRSGRVRGQQRACRQRACTGVERHWVLIIIVLDCC